MAHLIVLLMLACTMPAFATTYYVSPTGNDANSGKSPGMAWKTVGNVNSLDLRPGDTVLFQGGETFNGNLYFDAGDGNAPDNPLVISSYGGGRAILNAGTGFGISVYNTQGIHISDLVVMGSGMNTNLKNGIEFYVDVAGDKRFADIVVERVVVKEFGRVGVRIGAWNGLTGYDGLRLEDLDVHHNLHDGILVYGYPSPFGYPNKDVVIRGCASYQNPGIADPKSIKGNGIVISNTDRAVIEYCVAYENGQANVHCGGPGGVWAYDANAIVIQYCESYRNKTASTCDGLGFDLDGGTMNSIIQYCYSHDNAGGGYLLGQYANAKPWRNNICRYNISVNDGRTNASGITLFKGSPESIMDSALIYNNTIYTTPSASNPTHGAFQITEWNTGMQNIFVYNNIFIATGGAPLVSVPAKYNAFFAGNLYWTSGGPFVISYQGTTYNYLFEWRSVGDATATWADPRLSNLGTAPIAWPRVASSIDAYRAQKGSPTIDNGINLKSTVGIDQGNRDFFGIDVPSQNGYDIGAHEYSSTDTARNKPPVILQLRDTSMAMSTILDVPFRIKDESPYRVRCEIVHTPSTLFPAGSLRLFGSGPMQTLRLQPATGEAGVAEISIKATDEWDSSSVQRLRVTVGKTTSVEEEALSACSLRVVSDGQTATLDVNDGPASPVQCEVYSVSLASLVLRQTFDAASSARTMTIPVADLASGVYVVRVQRNGCVATSLLVISR